MANVEIGDIFEITTPKGNAYLYYIYRDSQLGEYIRVLPGLYSTRPENLNSLVAKQERYIILFPLIAAHKHKIVEKVGFHPSTNWSKPTHMRSEHKIKGVLIGWHIVNTDTWQRNLVENLSPQQKRLSPWGIWNDTLLIERLTSNWELQDWG